jgi:hypothetical protein
LEKTNVRHEEPNLAVEYAYAYAHAITFPLGGTLGQMARIVHRNFIVKHDGQTLTQVRFGLLAEDSRLNVELALERAVEQAANHYGVAAGRLQTQEVGAEEHAFVRPRRRKLP